MSWMDTERIENLERRVAILEGKPDPGNYCQTCNGTGTENYDWDAYRKCPKCGGTGRTYEKPD